MLYDHAHAMQVKLCKANTRGVTQGTSNYHPMHASFHFINHFLQSSIHHTSMDMEFKTCAMQANICTAHSNAAYKFMSLLPLLVCFKF